MEKKYGCYGANKQKMRRKNLFDTRFELLGSEMGKYDEKINSSGNLPRVPSPLVHGFMCVTDGPKICSNRDPTDASKETIFINKYSRGKRNVNVKNKTKRR